MLLINNIIYNSIINKQVEQCCEKFSWTIDRKSQEQEQGLAWSTDKEHPRWRAVFLPWLLLYPCSTWTLLISGPAWQGLLKAASLGLFWVWGCWVEFSLTHRCRMGRRFLTMRCRWRLKALCSCSLFSCCTGNALGPLSKVVSCSHFCCFQSNKTANAQWEE